jgi:hypothetical protein
VALGVALPERTDMGLGYRYAAVDYESGGFVYDVETKGLHVGVRIES